MCGREAAADVAERVPHALAAPRRRERRVRGPRAVVLAIGAWQSEGARSRPARRAPRREQPEHQTRRARPHATVHDAECARACMCQVARPLDARGGRDAAVCDVVAQTPMKSALEALIFSPRIGPRLRAYMRPGAWERDVVVSEASGAMPERGRGGKWAGARDCPRRAVRGTDAAHLCVRGVGRGCSSYASEACRRRGPARATMGRDRVEGAGSVATCACTTALAARAASWTTEGDCPMMLRVYARHFNRFWLGYVDSCVRATCKRHIVNAIRVRAS